MKNNFGETRRGAVRLGFLALLGGLLVWLGEARLLAIGVGDRVQAIAAVNVRATPAGTFMITRRIGDQGTVLEGPVVATLNGNVLNWLKINFDGAGTNRNPGWVAEIGLASIGVQPGNPLNAAPGTQTSPGLLLASNTVTLTWLGVPEASFYDLGVFDTVTGAAVTNTFVYLAGYATNDSMVTNWSFTVTLTPGREYRWNVAACNPAGSSAYTPVLFFRSPAPAQLAVTPASPATQPAAGGVFGLAVSNTGGGTMTYAASVTSDSPWLTITSGGAGTNAGTINLALAANTGGPQRSGTILVTAPGVAGSPITVTVVQAADITAPTITTAPRSTAVIVGATATFNVVANGTSPAYQWRREGTNLVGQTSSTLTIGNVALSAAGAYSVVVSNAAGVVTSAPVLLTVASSIIQPPAVQTRAEIQSSGFVLDVALEVGRTFRVQASSDLQTWSDVTSFVSTAQAVRFVDDAAKPLSRRFYRIVSP